MRIDFQAVNLKWFRSFTEPAEVLRLDEPGLWFVRGRNEVEPDLGANGAGKSTAFEAIVWCIYGRTTAGLKNPDIKSWAKKAKAASVTLELTIDDEPHKISREAVTNGLKIDDKEVGPEAAADLVGLSFEVFVNTVMQPQGQPLFFDLTPKDKMQLFTEVLDLHRWEERSAKASKAVRELELLKASMEGEYSVAQELLEKIEANSAKVREASTEWETKQKERGAQITSELKEAEAALAKQQPLLEEAELVADSAGAEAKALRLSINRLVEAANDARDAYTKASAEITALEREEQRLQREHDKLGDVEDCPVCGQSLEGTSLSAHQSKLRIELLRLQKQIDKGIPAKITKEKEGAVAALSLAQQQEREFEEKATTATQTINRLRAQVAEMKTKAALLQDEKNSRSEQRNPYTEQLQSFRRDKAHYERECEAFKTDLEKAEKKIKQTQFWVRGFKDVQLYIIEEVLQELEVATNTALAEVGLHDWQVNYDVEKETKAGTIQRGMNVTVLSPHNDKTVRWESWSGGEGQRLRVVGALALSQVLLNNAGITTNLEVLDEPTRHLSKEGVADLCDFLSERAKQTGKTIFLVDHAAREGSMFAGTVTVAKTAKGSRIEQ